MARCLVLGANGFIGSHLVDGLIASGHDVRAFGHFSDEPIFNSNENIEVYAGDFLNRGDLAKAVSGVDYVFHFISTTTPVTAENDPLVDIDSNIRMSVELLKICTEEKVKRVVFASTGGAIYGGDDERPRTEDELPQPVSPYAIGKLTIEHYLRFFRVKHGLDSVALRISNPYGERQPFHRKQGVIPIFLENAFRGVPLNVLGDGTMVRDYVYVKDLIQMIVAMFDQPTHEHTYNLGSGVAISVNELVDAVEQVTGSRPEVQYLPAPTTFVPKVVLDSNRFNSEFQIGATTDLIEGMKQTYEYIKEGVGNEGR